MQRSKNSDNVGGKQSINFDPGLVKVRITSMDVRITQNGH